MSLFEFEYISLDSRCLNGFECENVFAFFYPHSDITTKIGFDSCYFITNSNVNETCYESLREFSAESPVAFGGEVEDGRAEMEVISVSEACSYNSFGIFGYKKECIY